MLEGLFQPMHLLLILVIAIVFFGPKKLPEIGSGIGKSIREFKKAMSDINKPALEASEKKEVKVEAGAGAQQEIIK
jgi:sec-independent protein translocase protein TatA